MNLSINITNHRIQISILFSVQAFSNHFCFLEFFILRFRRVIDQLFNLNHLWRILSWFCGSSHLFQVIFIFKWRLILRKYSITNLHMRNIFRCLFHIRVSFLYYLQRRIWTYVFFLLFFAIDNCLFHLFRVNLRLVVVSDDFPVLQLFLCKSASYSLLILLLCFFLTLLIKYNIQ